MQRSDREEQHIENFNISLKKSRTSIHSHACKLVFYVSKPIDEANKIKREKKKHLLKFLFYFIFIHKRYAEAYTPKCVCVCFFFALFFSSMLFSFSFITVSVYDCIGFEMYGNQIRGNFDFSSGSLILFARYCTILLEYFSNESFIRMVTA